ncbi:uncharacterized protein RHOBADRAFT_52241 [Rhodotorula graminis WP1]|uniref:Monopolin complex subunit Csm1/Pcs1 C-terminal domain-containing protein n=1 Tax=Rhodotorula graminis (strain WP1) TaxID=578459 RepID=A0A194S9X3_RHOGW|nr:uncharacterized protein RHOBADRAFT_52241 [Rhodotorula graminis WP1]KPV76201.1 hypothetical protein RHOBADRAFT_52241 [Rhodotorula graminis WP1]
MNKENRAPEAASAKGSSSSTRARKPAATKPTTSNKRTTTARPKKASSASDDDDELMLDDNKSDNEGEGADETTLVAETHFEAARETEEQAAVPKGRGGKKAATAASTKKAPVKKAVPAAKKGKATAAAAAVEEEDDETLVRGLEEMDMPGEELSPREKKLAKQLEATKKALADSQAAQQKLRDLRTTRPEEAELRLREIADGRQQASVNTIATYKTENDSLRAELSSVQETAFASPRSKAARLESQRVHELEQENAALAARVDEVERLRAEEQARAEKDAVEREKKWEKKLARDVKEATQAMEKELVELRAEVSTARAELAAEVEHSKSLQRKLKAVPVSASLSSSTAAPTASSGPGSALAKLQEEHDRLTTHLNLNEDLTGFAVHSVKQDEDGATYTCVLTDCAGTTGSLNFKLMFHLDGTVGYQPDVNPERDAALAALLPADMQNYMRFAAENCAEFFKRLFAAVNRVKL